MGLSQDPAPADVVRRQYLASAAGDLEELRTTLALDVEWTEMAGFPLAGTYRTPDGVTANVMEKLAAEWEGWAAHDDTYVVEARTSSSGVGSSSGSNSSSTPHSSATPRAGCSGIGRWCATRQQRGVTGAKRAKTLSIGGSLRSLVCVRPTARSS